MTSAKQGVGVAGRGRKVAPTPLAQEIAALVDRYGSDEKLARVIGEGATRFTVMNWRVDGTVPEKQAYIARLAELGIDQKLLDGGAADELASRRSLMRRVEALEADGDDLRQALTDARRAHEALREQVAALEAAAARPASGRRRASG